MSKKLKFNMDEFIRGGNYDRCGECGLNKTCKSPQMKPYGNFKKKIMVVAQAPGEQEDLKNRPLIGKAGQLTRKALAELNIDLDEDCVIVNVLACRPPKNRKPSPLEMDCCRSRLYNDIKAYSPKLIIALGEEAMLSLLNPPSEIDNSISTFRGYVIPHRLFGCWVGVANHPSYILRMGGTSSDLYSFFLDDLDYALKHLDRDIKWPSPTTGQELDISSDSKEYMFPANELFDSMKALSSFLDCYLDEGFAIDFETNTLNPYDKDAKILTVALSPLSMYGDSGLVIPLEHKESPFTKKEKEYIYERLRFCFSSTSIKKVVHNYNFEALWCRVVLGCELNNVVADTMVNAHILDSRPKITKLKFQAFINGFDRYAEDIDLDNIGDTPLKQLALYNSLDARWTAWLYHKQLDEFREYPKLQEGVKLFTEALPSLLDMTYNGIKVDGPRFETLKTYYKQESDKYQTLFVNSNISKQFKKIHGREPEINGRNDLLELFYRVGKAPKKTTKKGNLSLNEAKLEKLTTHRNLNIANLAKFKLKWNKVNKMITTFIPAIEEYVVNTYIHPEYLLHTVRSYRSSSANPNAQQLPKRSEEGRKIRQVYVPRFDYLLEMDYSGNEVRHLAMLSKDENLIRFIKDGRDFHREYASKIFQVPLEKVTSQQRYEAKNGFVFPSFYGAQPPSIAAYFRKPAIFFAKLQNALWQQFPFVKQFQQEELDFYSKHGYVQLATGFRRYGPMLPTEVINTGVQGPAFHTLLFNINKMRNEMKSASMESKIISETHDSVLFDVKEKEKTEIITLSKKIFTTPVWEFQKEVPLEVEFEIGKNWYEMKGI